MNQIISPNEKELGNGQKKLSYEEKANAQVQGINKTTVKTKVMNNRVNPKGRRNVVINTKKVRALILLIAFTTLETEFGSTQQPDFPLTV